MTDCQAGWIWFTDSSQVSLQAKADGREGDPEPPGILKKASQTVSSKLGRLESDRGERDRCTSVLRNANGSGQGLQPVSGGLTELVPMTDSRKIAFKVASTLIQRGPGRRRIGIFQGPAGPSATSQAVLGGEKKVIRNGFWNLVNGPIRFYHTYAAREAQCQLQSIWEKEVYLEVQDMPQGTNLNQLLMGHRRLCGQILKGPAEPFIGRSRSKGYFAKKCRRNCAGPGYGFFDFSDPGRQCGQAGGFRVPGDHQGIPHRCQQECGYQTPCHITGTAVRR
jgi:hypothetical protein